jgi:hypothetical protein
MKSKSLKSQYYAEYGALKNAADRCSRRTHSQWKDYGGRGLTVEPAWLDPLTGFETFFAEVGAKPNPTDELDRKNNDLGYVSGNVRWISHAENMKNRRKPIGKHQDLGWGLSHIYIRDRNGRLCRQQCQLVPFNNELMPIQVVAQKLKLKLATLRQRVKKGWTPERTFAATLYSPKGKPRIN